ATAMYVSERNPLKKLTYKSKKIAIPRGLEQRRLQKALLRYHDPANWPIIREALRSMRKPHLIGNSVSALVPDETADNRTKSRPGHNPNARAQAQKTRGSGAPAAKPAAKAFGDKFESAKKFNAQTATKPKTAVAVKDTRNNPKAKPGISAINKARPGKPKKSR